MTGFIFNILRFTLHDGPGIRTTVFLKGCPLHCTWCHNPEGISSLPIECEQIRNFDNCTFIERTVVGRYIGTEELLHTLTRDHNFYRESGGGVTFSGGEPLAQAPFLLNILQHCKKSGIHTCVDTSAYADNEYFIKIAINCDLLLIDLKHADDTKHIENTGVSNKKIIDNLKSIIHHVSTPVWLRLPMIPGFNMDHQSWMQMCTLLDQIKSEQIKQIHLLPFHRIADHKHIKCNTENKMKGISSVNNTELLPYYNQLLDRGWKKVFIGG